MRHSVSGLALMASLSMAQGCTVSDTLTPPLDVGTSGSISKPLNHSDMQTAMDQNQYGYGGPVSRQPPEQAYPEQAYPEQAPQMADNQPSPQNSLDAQAQALQNGYNPVASTPLDETPAQ